METIRQYIETMFQNLPDAPSVQRAKAELAEMMEDKYNALRSRGKSENEAIGQVIVEFGNLDELAEELGIRAEVHTNKADSNYPEVELDEVQAFVEKTYIHSARIAVGVAMCILSPIMLILLGYRSVIGLISEAASVSLGLAFMFVFIAAAVAFFIRSGMELDKFEYLEKTYYTLSDSAISYAKREKEAHERKNSNQILGGVMIIILSVAAFIIYMVLNGGKNEMHMVNAICVWLACISLGVGMLIHSGMKDDCYSVILKHGGINKNYKRGSTIAEDIIAGYWPFVIAVYLIVSFVWDSWGSSWIIWIVAGVIRNPLKRFLRRIIK